MTLRAPLIYLILLASNFASAQGATELEAVKITDQKRRIKEFETSRVQRVEAKSLQTKKALSFAEMIQGERGVETQTACAFCGAKRISINGLKGEHTTILVDGLSLHSTVSSFYGVEAIPMNIIDSIDVYRGAGAALTAPESIGGAINLVTKPILADQAELALGAADDRSVRASVSATKKLTESAGFFIGLESNEARPWDGDDNRIAESPWQKTNGVSAKWTKQLAAGSELSLRTGYGYLKTVGGAMQDLSVSQAPNPTVSPDDFQDRDVRKRYLGDESRITDNVELTRKEAALIYTLAPSDNSSLKLALGRADQDQAAIYSHGYDYDNQDQIWSGLAEYQRSINEWHLLTLGADFKRERMRSQSKVLFDQKGLAKDDLDFGSQGIFVQDTWTPTESTEVAVSLRLDQLRTDWIALDESLGATIVAPRFLLKHQHSEVLTSRLALGLGYRPPLTLFESQHGSDHNGFLIDINEIERAKSGVYSLLGQWQDDFFEVGVHLTEIENMAYGLDQAQTNDPTVFRNANENYLITVLDAGYGRRVTPEWSLEGVIESFQYPAGYKEKLPVAAIEQRLTLLSNIETEKWKFSQKLTVIGARDLSAYGYDRHYNIAPSEDPLDPSFGGGGEDQKWQKSPTYAVVDLSFRRQLLKRGWAELAILNLFDYTQTKAGDSPTTWHQHGTHFHLDNFHIWGPLKGRQIFVSVGADL